MKPKLLNWKNSWVLAQSVVFCVVIPIVIIFSHLNPDTWGEKVQVGGWVVLSMTIVASVIATVLFYYHRWVWVSKWRFTTPHGIMCFFEPYTKLYLCRDVTRETEDVLDRWNRFIRIKHKESSIIPAHALNHVICVFRTEGTFNQSKLGFKDRLVYGMSGWKWMVIGTGGKPIKDTAYAHECSHICVNIWKNKVVSDHEAHEIFKEIGI